MSNQKCRLCRCFWIFPEEPFTATTENQYRQPDFARNFREKIQKSGFVPIGFISYEVNDEALFGALAIFSKRARA